MTDRAIVREVSLRDGLLVAAALPPTKTKIEWCQPQRETGLEEIGVTSIVPSKFLPQFSDAADVLAVARTARIIKSCP